MKKILLTGGGTAGHVTPHIALLPTLAAEGYAAIYVGRHSGIEKDLIEKCGLPYFGIASGKLRRYFDMQNVKDAFNVLRGLSDAIHIVRREKPDVIFSKGGFVAVPVVVAGRLCRVPVVIHESDMSPGLANKLSIPFCNAICVSFPETMPHLPKHKTILTGTPIRQALLQGDRRRGLALCGFHEHKPVVLVMGGSSGSVKINACLRSALPTLLQSYQITHICGKNNVDDTIRRPGYTQFDYIDDQLPDIMAAADVVVSRAGANAIAEIAALKKPALLIPLSKRASRGDQILNAQSFARRGYGTTLLEENLHQDSLTEAIDHLCANRAAFVEKLSSDTFAGSASAIIKVIRRYSL